MTEQSLWETRFVEAFVKKLRRDRYNSFLRNSRKRIKLLDRLNHSPDLDFDRAVEIAGQRSFYRDVEARLSSIGVDEHAWLVSADDNLDGRRVSLGEGVELLTSADWGTVLICPPKPVALYRSEDCELYLFQ